MYLGKQTWEINMYKELFKFLLSWKHSEFNSTGNSWKDLLFQIVNQWGIFLILYISVAISFLDTQLVNNNRASNKISLAHFPTGCWKKKRWFVYVSNTVRLCIYSTVNLACNLSLIYKSILLTLVIDIS